MILYRYFLIYLTDKSGSVEAGSNSGLLAHLFAPRYNHKDFRQLLMEDRNALVGGYINLGYRLSNGKIANFLDDNATYWGNQPDCESGGEHPELVIYKKRSSHGVNGDICVDG